MRLLLLFCLTLSAFAQQTILGGQPKPCDPNPKWEVHWGYYFDRESGEILSGNCEHTDWFFEDAKLIAPGQFAEPVKLMPYAFATAQSAEKIKAMVEKHVLPMVAADLKINIRENLIKSPVFWRTKPERQLCLSKSGTRDFHCANAGLLISQLLRTPLNMWITLVGEEIAKAVEKFEQ